MSAQGEGICVGIRMRPLNERERNGKQSKVFQVDGNSVSQIMPNGQIIDTAYFDKVFDENVNNDAVYSHTAKPIVAGVLKGINGTIFAYGQTSSGKTHTMLGSGGDPGVLNMAADDIFEHIANHPNRDFILRASFVEIYNENIRDLLATRSGANEYISIRVDPRRGVYCEAEERMVSSYEQINALLKEGISRRTVEATAMNEHSSRSHTIFRLVIESRESDRDGRESDGAVLVGTLNLVDLAGSESVRNTGATGQRAKEGGNINKSLLALSMVIQKLSTQSQHVSFRDSKLTHLLQPSLSGNAKMAIICCITPASNYQDETRSTLQFASGAKLVKTHATVNEVVDEATQIRRLKREVELLRAASSDEAVIKYRQLEQKTKELEATIEQMRAHYESSASVESKRDETADGESPSPSDRRSSKRHRVAAEEPETEGEEGPRSVANIQGTLAQMLARRAAMAGAVPAVVTAAVETANHAAPRVPAPEPTKVEETKAPVINPMTLGLRNMLMKELDFKLVARRKSVSEAESGAKEVSEMVVEAKDPAVSTANVALIEQLQQEVADLQEQMAKMTAEQQNMVAERDSEITRLQGSLNAAFEQMEQQQTDAIELEERFEAAKEQIATLQAQLAEAAVAKCVDLTVATSAVEAEASQLKEQGERIAQLEQEVAALKETLDASETETLNLLEQLEQSQKCLSAQEGSLAQRMAEKDTRLAGAVAEANTAAEEIVRLQGELDSAMKASSELAQQMVEKDTRLAGAMREASDAAEEIGRLQSELDAAVEASTELKASLAAAEVSVADLQQQNAALQATVDELEMAKATAHDSVAKLEEARAADAETIAGMEAKMSEIIDQGLLAEEHLESARDSLTELQGTLAAAEDKVSELTAELSLAQSATAEAEAALTSTQEDLAAAHADLQAAQDQVEHLQQALQQAVEAATVAAADVDKITPETVEALEAAKAMVATLEERVASMESEALQSMEEANTLTEKLLAAEAVCEAQATKIGELEGALEQATEQTATLTESLAAAEGAKADLVEKVATLEAEVAEHVASAKASEEMITEHEASLLKALDDQQAVEAELSELQTRLDTVSAEKERVAAELSAAQEKAAVVETEAAALRERLEAVEEELNNVKPTTPTAASVGRLAEFDMTQESLDATRRETERVVGAIRAELGSKEAEVSRLMAALTEVQERATVAEQRLAAMDSTGDETEEQLRKRCGQLQTTVDLLGSEKETLVVKLQAAERELKAQEAKAYTSIEKLERDCANWESKVERLQQEVAQTGRLQENANELRRRLEDLVAQRDAQQHRADAAVARVQDLEEALEDLKASAAAMPTEALVEEALQEEKLQLQRDLAEIAARLKKSQEASAQLREQWETAEAERNALQEQLAAVEAEKDALSADLEAALDNINTLTEALEEANEANDAALAAAAANNANVAAASGIAMVPLIDSSAEEVATLTEALETLKAEKAGLQERTDIEREEFTKRIESLEEQVAASDELNAELEKALAEAEEQVSQLTERIAAMTEDVNAAQQERAMMATDHQQSSGVCKYQAEQIADLIAQLDAAKAASIRAAVDAETLAQLTEAKEVLEQRVQVLESDISALRVELEQRTAAAAEELEMATASANEEIAFLQQQLEAKDEELAHATAEVELAKTSVGDEIAALQEQLQAKEEEVAQVNAELNLAKSSIQDEIAALQQQLSGKEEEVAQAMELVKSAAQEEVSALQLQLEAKDEEVAQTRAELSRLQSSLEDVQMEVANLQNRSATQSRVVEELESELETLRQQSEQSASVDSVAAELAAMKDELQSTRESLRAANEHCAVNEDMVTSLQEQLQVKEARIQHLETCKLTKEQMEKIKVMKEERKKYQEDAKVLKKQLQALTVKFEELKQSAKKMSDDRAAGVVGGGPATDYIISDLKVQLVTTTQQLSQTQDEVRLLKSKLKECAVQLKEYENDHNGVVAVLEKYGVDTRGLIPLDHSVDEESSASAVHVDIADAVAQLGEKLDLAKAAVSRREICKSEKLAELEERLAQQSADAEEAKAQRVVLEKRIDAMKAAAKTAREEAAKAALEIETLTLKVKEQKEELAVANKRVVSSTEVASSEVQALEEENIELLKENKELRQQVSRLKAGLPAAAPVVASAAPTPSAATSMFSPVPKTASSAAPSAVALSGQKRAFGTDISNTAPSSAVKRSQQEVSKPTPSVADAIDDAGDKGKTRRGAGRKKVQKVEEGQATAENPECVQS